MRYFCTYFNKNYLSRGLALYYSLERQVPEFELFVLCLDDETCSILNQLSLDSLTTVALTDLEHAYPELLSVKDERSTIEYFFTCSPALPLYIFSHFAKVDLLTYVDADLYFYSSLDPIYNELGLASIAIVEHRFHLMKKKNMRYGKYNVGLLVFRRDEAGLSCLNWWKDQCVDWCYDRLEGERFADQKYLEQWPSLFNGVVVLQNKGVNLAPWNIGNYKLLMRNGNVLVDEDSLLVFHFHGLKRLKQGYWDSGLGVHLVRCSRLIREKIFTPYINELDAIERILEQEYKVNIPSSGIRPPMDRGWPSKVTHYVQVFVRVMLGNYIKLV